MTPCTPTLLLVIMRAKVQ